VAVWLVAFMILIPLSLPAQEQNQAPSVVRNLSQVFTNVADEAVPAVVYVTVEKTVETGRSPSGFNDPFDLFNEEFFERFFGQRFPGEQQPREFRQQGQGSGFIISSDGLILTNDHVVGEADKVTVQLADGREFQAKIIGTDPRSDVAVIKIDGENLPVLPLSQSETLEVGEWVMAIGNPFGLTHTITVGVVSATGRNRLGIVDYEDFIQTDAAINPGNSGGPLVNMQGEVVGINTAIFSRSGGYMGIGFAIPISMAEAIKEQLVTRGKVVRGYLGIRIQELTKELAQSFGLETTQGVLIAEVSQGSPAAEAGLQSGDIIVSVNGESMSDVSQLRNTVAMMAPGTEVSVEIVRDGKRREITVELGELPSERTAQTMERQEEEEPISKLGLGVQNLTAELAEQLGYENREGVVVTRVEPNSAASQAGIRRGMLIRQVNRQDVDNLQEFQAAFQKSRNANQVLLLVQDQQASRYVVLPVG
jgi:serine protease Do